MMVGNDNSIAFIVYSHCSDLRRIRIIILPIDSIHFSFRKTGDEYSFVRAMEALRLFYHSDDGPGAPAPCLPFASGGRQTTVAESYPEDQVIRSPRLRKRRFTRSRSKQDACAPIKDDRDQVRVRAIWRCDPMLRGFL